MPGEAHKKVEMVRSDNRHITLHTVWPSTALSEISPRPLSHPLNVPQTVWRNQQWCGGGHERMEGAEVCLTARTKAARLLSV